MHEPEECENTQTGMLGMQHQLEISGQVINQSALHIWMHKTKHVPVPYNYNIKETGEVLKSTSIIDNNPQE